MLIVSAMVVDILIKVNGKQFKMYKHNTKHFFYSASNPLKFIERININVCCIILFYNIIFLSLSFSLMLGLCAIKRLHSARIMIVCIFVYWLCICNAYITHRIYIKRHIKLVPSWLSFFFMFIHCYKH